MDECTVSCPDHEDCVPTVDGYICQPLGSVCGRPLQLAGAPRVSSLTARDDWTEALTPRILSATDRQTLGEWWSMIGALEHASVAGFARFSLQLMALGAPPDLVFGAQQAGADEVNHAKLAYGLASAYLGQKNGPFSFKTR